MGLTLKVDVSRSHQTGRARVEDYLLSSEGVGRVEWTLSRLSFWRECDSNPPGRLKMSVPSHDGEDPPWCFVQSREGLSLREVSTINL